MGRRHSLILLELVAAVTAALSVLAGVAFFLLTMGPIRLDFLTPYIESALSPAGAPIAVRINSTKLTWDGWQRPVDVRADHVRILNPAGTELATLDEVSIGLSIPGLMRGLVAPTSLEIRKPTVRLTRARDGHLEFGLGDSAQGREQPALQRLIEGLQAPLNPLAASGYLDRVSISDAVLTYYDEKLELEAQALNANVEMVRNEHGIGAFFQIPFIVDGKPAAVRGKVQFARETGTLDVAAEFAKVVPASLAAGSSALRHLAALDLPMDGEITARLRASGGLERPVFEVDRVVFDISGRDGRLKLKEFGPQGIEVVGAKIVGRANQDSVYVLENVYFDFGGPNLSAAAVVSSISGQPEAKVNAVARNFSVADLDRLWPAGMRPDLRDWVRSNVRSGRADETVIETVGRMSPDHGFQPDYNRLKLESRFSGVAADAGDSFRMQDVSGSAKFGPEQLSLAIAGGSGRFVRGDLPPITDIKARATLVPNRQADVAILDAKFAGMNLMADRIQVKNLDKPVPEVDGEAHLYGNLGRLVTLLQKADIGGIRELDIDPGAVKGAMGLKARFRFELSPTLKFDRVSHTATMTIQDMAIPKGPMGLQISDGDLKLVYDAKDVKAEGQIRLNGAPVAIDLKRTLVGQGPNPTHIHLAGSLSDAQRKALGLDTEKFLDGPVDFAVDLLKTDGVTTTANARLKLDRAKFRLAQLYWEKEAKVPASLDMTITLRKGHAAEINEFAMSGGGMRAEGRAWMISGSSDVERILFNRLAFGGADGTDVKAQFQRRAGGGWDVTVEGQQLNLQPYIDDPDILIDFPLDVKTRLKRLRLDARRTLQDVDLTASYGGEYWDRIDLVSQRGTANDFRVRYQPLDDQSDQRDLYIYSSDAGAALQLMTDANIARDVRGGDLLVKATRYPMQPNMPMEGVVRIEGFSLRDSPTGEKILASSAGFGPFELLSSSDLNFTVLDARFRKTGDRIELLALQALSQGLGISLAGMFDAGQGTMNIEGYVSPFRGICDLLNDTPWVGAFLVGTDKQGLIAVDVKAQGSVTDPDFVVSKKPRSLPRGDVREFARLTNSCGKIKDLSPESRMQPAGLNK